MCWLGTLIHRKGFPHVTGMGDSQPLLGLNTTTALGQLPVPTGKNSTLEDIDLHRNTRAPLLNPLFLLPPFLFITPSSLSWSSWQVPWRFRQDSLRLRKLAKRKKDEQIGMEKGKGKSHHLHSLLQLRQKGHEATHCAALMHLGSAREQQPWKLKKTPRNPRIFYSPYSNVR